MTVKLMYITDDDTQNYPLCRLQLVVEMFAHSTWWINQSKFPKVPKVVRPTNKKTMGIIVLNSPLSPPPPWSIQETVNPFEQHKKMIENAF